MELNETISKYIGDTINETPTLTRQHYTWFLEIFADACKKNNIRRQIYINLATTLMTDFAQTNPQFNQNMFMVYARKLYNADTEETVQ